MTGPLDRLDGSQYGDPDDAAPAELHREAPPCDGCGEQQAVERVDGRDLCDQCRGDSA